MATITAKFASKCPLCGHQIQASTLVIWKPGEKARHVDCGSATPTTSTTQKEPPKRRANWRCPNPRDCGDPTCDGNCGY